MESLQLLKSRGYSKVTGMTYNSNMQGNVFALIQIFINLQCRIDISLHLCLYLVSCHFGINQKVRSFSKSGGHTQIDIILSCLGRFPFTVLSRKSTESHPKDEPKK